MLTEPEAAFSYEAVDAFNVQFINQSQFVYPDSTDGGRYLWSFGDGTTSNEPHPQHTFPEVAEYEVTLTAIVCSDTSVYTQTVSTTPTGIKPQARAESITVLPPSPNPAASGLPVRIGVEFPYFIQNKTALVRLYDINGRLLHEGQQIGGGRLRVAHIGGCRRAFTFTALSGKAMCCSAARLLCFNPFCRRYLPRRSSIAAGFKPTAIERTKAMPQSFVGGSLSRHPVEGCKGIEANHVFTAMR